MRQIFIHFFILYVLFGRMLYSSKKNILHECNLPNFPRLIRSQSRVEEIQDLDKSLEKSTNKIEDSPGLICSKVFKKRNIQKQRSKFWSQELKKIIDRNKLTINITEKSNKQEIEELKRQNFSQLQSQLVRESVFQFYKQLNQKIGCSEDLILNQYRLQQQIQMRFRLDPKFKIKMRKNIYQKQTKQNKRSHSTSLLLRTHYQTVNSAQIKSKKQNLKARLSEKLLQRKDKWKLTDFFNSIVTEQQKVDEQAENQRLKLELASKLTKLEKECRQLSENGNQRYLLEIFKKFNQKVNDKLYKKQKRLSKLKFIMRNVHP